MEDNQSAKLGYDGGQPISKARLWWRTANQQSQAVMGAANQQSQAEMWDSQSAKPGCDGG